MPLIIKKVRGAAGGEEKREGEKGKTLKGRRGVRGDGEVFVFMFM